MIRFILVFLSIFISVHALFFFRIRVLFADRIWVQSLVILFFLLMTFAPVAAYVLDRNGYDPVSRIISYIGFVWMGFIFIAFCLSVLMGIYDLFAWSVNRFAPFQIPFLYGKIQTLIMIGSIILLCLYGVYEARHIRIEQVTIETDKLPADKSSLRIAQISDIHLGMILREKFIGRVVAKLESIHPDILVCTGDYVDSSLRNVNHLTEDMSRLEVPFGKYAVTGNHESFDRIDQTIAFLENSGFTMLRGETKTIPRLINITGVDDSRSRGGSSVVDRTKVLPALPETDNGLFTLVLKHRPIVAEETLGRFDLQLSGHTHKGQIFPFNLIVKKVFPLLDGFYDLGKGSKLYVNRGTGTWGPPMRILAPPEITVIELIALLPTRLSPANIQNSP